MKLHHIILSVLFVALITLSFNNFYVPTGNYYQANTSNLALLNKSYGPIEAQMQSGGQLEFNETREAMTGVKMKEGTAGLENPYVLIKQAVATIKTFGQSFTILGNLMSSITSIFSTLVGASVIQNISFYIWAGISIIAISMLIYAWLKWEVKL